MNKFMKTIALSMAMLCLGAGAAGAAQFSDAQSGKNLTAAQLASKLQKYDVVFFGEYHDQSEIHQYELELLKAMYKAKGEKLALSMEMFEVDNQSKLNNFWQILRAKKIYWLPLAPGLITVRIMLRW